MVLLLVFRSLCWYELVQDKLRKFPPPQMPLTPYIRMLRVHIYQVFVIILTLMNSRRGWPLFFSGPRVGAVAKTCPHRPQALEKAKMIKRFRREKFFFFICFWTKRMQVLQGMTCLWNVSRKHSKIWPADVQHKYTITQNSILYYTQVITNNYAKCRCFRHKTLNVDADFKRQWNFAHVFCVSTPRRDLQGLFPFFFPPSIFGLRRSKFPE